MVNFSRIEDLALHDASIRHLLSMYRDNVASKEEALIMMVIISVQNKDHYLKKVIELEQQKGS